MRSRLFGSESADHRGSRWRSTSQVTCIGIVICVMIGACGKAGFRSGPEDFLIERLDGLFWAHFVCERFPGKHRFLVVSGTSGENVSRSLEVFLQHLTKPAGHPVTADIARFPSGNGFAHGDKYDVRESFRQSADLISRALQTKHNFDLVFALIPPDNCERLRLGYCIDSPCLIIHYHGDYREIPNRNTIARLIGENRIAAFACPRPGELGNIRDYLDPVPLDLPADEVKRRFLGIYLLVTAENLAAVSKSIPDLFGEEGRCYSPKPPMKTDAE